MSWEIFYIVKMVKLFLFAIHHLFIICDGNIVSDLTVMTLPPPAGGATVLTVLNVLDLYGVKPANRSVNVTYHHFIEVC